MPNSCLVCGHTKGKDDNVGLHRFPKDKSKLYQWLKALNLKESDIGESSRVCSRHFPNSDTNLLPSLQLGKHSASPKKRSTARAKRAIKRQKLSFSVSTQPRSKSASAQPESTDDDQHSSSVTPTCMTPLSACIGEPLLSETEYNIHELPSGSDDVSVNDLSVNDGQHADQNDIQVTVNAALIARVEALEAENKALKKQVSETKSYFRIENIDNNDSLIHFYTGFVSYEILLCFFEFLGPCDRLQYWGFNKPTTGRKRRTKLSPLNQLFLTLVKLRLNLSVKDLSYRFGISTGLISEYVTTWICFMYNQLKEIDWMPTTKQVAGTLPHRFKEKYPKTYVIIDASEVFIETPSDLHMQSSTWSNYKHHNTAKFLIGCTPNGVISYVSQLYVGSISDVELTRRCGFLETLAGKSGASVMADRGFTIRDLLNDVGVELNIPPFMERRDQLPASEVKAGRQIASLRIHVERAIGRIKHYRILKGTLPLSMARLANQIVSVCAWLTNFLGVLVPTTGSQSEDDVDDYLQYAFESDSDYDADQSDTCDSD